MRQSNWIETTRHNPCSRCQKVGWCSRSDDGNFEICRRYNDGSAITKVDKNGSEYYLYSLGPKPPGPNGSNFRSYRKPPKLEEEAPQADPIDKNAVYSALLELLTLEQKHFDQLVARGLPKDEINDEKFRTLLLGGRSKIISEMLKRFDKNTLLKIPGFYINSFNQLKLAGAPGLIIPIRDVDNLIVGLLTRLDEPKDKTKYVWLSSKKKGGPGPGAPVHVPITKNVLATRARFTEGALKSHIANALSEIRTIGMAGVGIFVPALKIFKKLKIRTVVLAIDMDALTNRVVAECLQKMASAFRKEGFEIEIETWDPKYKGIDDALAAKAEIKCHSGLEATKVIKEIVSAARTANPTAKETTFANAKKLIAEALAKLKSEPGIVMEPEILRALLTLKSESQSDWTNFLAAIKGKVSVRELNKALEREQHSVFRENSRAKNDDDNNYNNADTTADFQPSEGKDRHPLYEVKYGRLYWNKITKDAIVPTPLSNFTAKIEAEEFIDDGIDQRKFFVVSGQLDNGIKLEKIKVPSENFLAMQWPIDLWGSRAVPTAGVGKKDHLRAAIQELSDNIIMLKSYGHLGWRLINDKWHYLISGGAISEDGLIDTLRVDPGDGKLKCYGLPKPPEGEELLLAIRASLSILDLAPAHITYSLMAGTYTAPLGEIRKIDFSIFLFGVSGIGKTELAALAQSHYGKEFHAKNLPGNWSSTSNALENQAFIVKDGLFTVDDFSPQPTANDTARLNQAAERLFRAQGNRSGRGRLDNKIRQRAERYPRGLILSTGEDKPRGLSLLARIIILELTDGDIDFKKLTSLQEAANQGLFAQAMSSYIQWLAGRIEFLKPKINELHHQRRAALTAKNIHKRSPDIAATLSLGFSLFLEFAVETKAISELESQKYFEKFVESLISTSHSQGVYQAAEDPVSRALKLICASVTSGRAHLADAKTGAAPENAQQWGWQKAGSVLTGEVGHKEDTYIPKGDRIGWICGDELWLEPSMAYATAQRLASDQKTIISVTEQTLWKYFKDRKLITVPEKESRFTQRRTVNGERTYVLLFPNKNILWDGPNASFDSPDSS